MRTMFMLCSLSDISVICQPYIIGRQLKHQRNDSRPQCCKIVTLSLQP
jgi:hypothetical protein